MNSSISVQMVQQAIQKMDGIDGWLIYNYRKSNPFAYEILDIAPTEHITRRFLYWIPREGEPVKVVHAIEPHVVDHLPGKETVYASWKDFEFQVLNLLRGKKKIAVEYSPMNHIPTLSRLDAGTAEWMHSLGVSVVSSWPILEQWLSRWTDQQRQLHKEAARVLLEVFTDSFQMIRDALQNGRYITELHVQEHILRFLHEHGCITSHLPICAVNDNAARPHYAPSKEENREIKKGDLILLDVWCKKNISFAPFADFTQVVLASDTMNLEIARVYSIVLEAQKAAIDFLESRFSEGKDVFGYEVDDAVREAIAAHSLDAYFTHRTGHNIHTVVHGHATHLDNFETHDTRRLMTRTCFSIEPGIYLPGKFGCRLECNAYITDDRKLEITGEAPESLPLLF